MGKTSANEELRNLIVEFQLNEEAYNEMVPEPYWEERAKLCKRFEDATRREGFVSGLSKLNLLRLVSLQGKMRYMKEHTFYIQFHSALNELKKAGKL